VGGCYIDFKAWKRPTMGSQVLSGFTEKLWRLTAALRERVWLSPLLPRFHLRVFLWHTEVIEGHQFTWLRNGPMFLGKAEYEEVVSPGFEMRMWSCQSQI
jgi:hypothetical protein